VATRAKLFQNRGRQAVRVPNSFGFPDVVTEVIIRREGSRIILEPVDEWSPEFMSVLGAWDEGDIPRPEPDSAATSRSKDWF
jgi:virulence-associated protein VagC